MAEDDVEIIVKCPKDTTDEQYQNYIVEAIHYAKKAQLEIPAVKDAITSPIVRVIYVPGRIINLVTKEGL